MPEFDTILTALNALESDYTVKSLWYDDLKRKIVTREPHHSNKILLANKSEPYDTNEILEEITDWHTIQYHEDILYEAEHDALSYDDLFDFLNIDCRIFYDAARVIQQRIFNNPEQFGLQKIMHSTKSLAFIPKKKQLLTA